MDLLSEFDGTIDQSGTVLLYRIYAGIGDLFWRTTLFRELKRRNPKLKLVISSQGPNWKLIYRDNPHIDELREIKDEDSDLDDVDFYIEDKLCPHVVTDYGLKLHAIDTLSKWSGIEIFDKSYWYETTEEEDKWAKEFIKNIGAKKLFGLGLRASTWVRTWSPLETKRFIKMLMLNDIHIIMFDSISTDLYDKNISSMAGGYNIREVAAVIKQLDCMITPDTGVLHIAAHFRIPTVAIFGGTSPEQRIRYYPTVVPVLSKKRFDCWPCFLHQVECPYGIPAPCLGSISAEQVLKEVEKII